MTFVFIQGICCVTSYFLLKSKYTSFKEIKWINGSRFLNPSTSVWIKNSVHNEAINEIIPLKSSLQKSISQLVNSFYPEHYRFHIFILEIRELMKYVLIEISVGFLKHKIVYKVSSDPQKSKFPLLWTFTVVLNKYKKFQPPWYMVFYPYYHVSR